MMEIRTAVPGDLAEIRILERRCGIRDPYGQLPARMSEHPEQFLLMRVEGRLIGCAEGAPVIPGEDIYGQWHSIRQLMIDPCWQKLGAEGVLIKEVIEQARSRRYEGVYLTCSPERCPFYAEYGFVRTGEAEKEILMRIAWQ
ncbi:MAG: GNAT family N-acetyltransferase [Stecheria intestinalis]|nr:GNAT family N-acetyltransferase [Stecheria intestinalis]MDD7679428.1 GNAT family N-acetyltransferase [Stecheria intestinalis]MDY4681116.1 GNAT family N-acetyltransferase [Lachnospiraceae bacterium]